MKKLFSLVFVAMLTMSAWADTSVILNNTATDVTEVTFDPMVDTGNGSNIRHAYTVAKYPVIMYVGDGTIGTNHQYRIYGPNDSSAFVLTSVAGPIIKIEFFGLFGYAAKHLSLAEGIGGTWTTSGDDGVWEGMAYEVAFDVNRQARAHHIVVTVGGTIDPPFLLGDVNHDRVVNITDVTMLNNMLLTDATDIPFEADLSHDGAYSVTDLTMLINLVLTQ